MTTNHIYHLRTVFQGLLLNSTYKSWSPRLTMNTHERPRWMSSKKRVVIVKKSNPSQKTTPLPSKQQQIHNKNHRTKFKPENPAINNTKSHAKQSNLSTSTPPPSKPFVQFDLKRLSTLSGFEKLELFRDFLKTKQIASAVQVYHKLEENGIITRLQYTDHNKLLKQLAQRQPHKYKTDILRVFQHITHISPPTLSTLTLLLQCACTWKDISLVLHMVELLEKGNHALHDIELWNNVLDLLSQFGIAQNREGISLWNRIRGMADLEVNVETYGKVMILYAKLGDKSKMESTYEEAVERFLFASKKDVHDGLHDTIQVQLTTYHMQSLAYISLVDAKKVYQGIIQKGILSQRDRVETVASRTLFTQAMVIAQLDKDPQFGIAAFEEMMKRGIRPDLDTYAKLILLYGEVSGTEETVLKDIYERAMAERSVRPDSLSHASLLEAFCLARLFLNVHEEIDSPIFEDLHHAIKIYSKESQEPSSYLFDYLSSPDTPQLIVDQIKSILAQETS